MANQPPKKKPKLLDLKRTSPLIKSVSKANRLADQLASDEDTLYMTIGERGMVFYDDRDLTDDEKDAVKDSTSTDSEDEGTDNKLSDDSFVGVKEATTVNGDAPADTGWIRVELINGWTNVDDFTPAKIRVVNEVVYLKGSLQNTDPDAPVISVAFEVPEEVRAGKLARMWEFGGRQVAVNYASRQTSGSPDPNVTGLTAPHFEISGDSYDLPHVHDLRDHKHVMNDIIGTGMMTGTLNPLAPLSLFIRPGIGLNLDTVSFPLNNVEEARLDKAATIKRLFDANPDAGYRIQYTSHEGGFLFFDTTLDIVDTSAEDASTWTMRVNEYVPPWAGEVEDWDGPGTHPGTLFLDMITGIIDIETLHP